MVYLLSPRKDAASLFKVMPHVHLQSHFELDSLNPCYYSVQTFLSPRLLSKNLKIKIYKTIIFSFLIINIPSLALSYNYYLQNVALLFRHFNEIL